VERRKARRLREKTSGAGIVPSATRMIFGTRELRCAARRSTPLIVVRGRKASPPAGHPYGAMRRRNFHNRRIRVFSNNKAGGALRKVYPPVIAGIAVRRTASLRSPMPRRSIGSVRGSPIAWMPGSSPGVTEESVVHNVEIASSPGDRSERLRADGDPGPR